MRHPTSAKRARASEGEEGGDEARAATEKKEQASNLGSKTRKSGERRQARVALAKRNDGLRTQQADREEQVIQRKDGFGRRMN